MSTNVTMNSRIPDCKLFLGLQEMTIKHQAGFDQGRLILHVTYGGVQQSFPMALERKSSFTVVSRQRNSSHSSSNSCYSNNNHNTSGNNNQDICEADVGVWRPITASTTAVPNPLQRHSNMRIWDFSDYSGSSSVLIELEQCNYLGWKKKIVAKNIIPLRTLLSQQDNDISIKTTNSESQTQQQVVETENYPSLCAVYSLSLHVIDDKSKKDNAFCTNNTNMNNDATNNNNISTSSAAQGTSYVKKKEKEKKVKFSGKDLMQLNTPFSNSTSRASSASYSPINTSTPPTTKSNSHQKVKITLSLQYRVILLQRCLQKQSTTLNIHYLQQITSPCNHNHHETLHFPSLEKHTCSEFHLLAAYAPSLLLIEIMKTLAWRGVLNRALALLSGSHQLSALEYALLANNSDNVLELLQRTGKLCFPRLKTQSPCILHLAVIGNCVTGMDVLCRFLKKYGPEFLVSDTGIPVNQHLSLSTLLEWRDAEDCTPLMLTCRLSTPRDNLLRVLLLSGADVTATQSKTGVNALMFACAKGHTSMVEILLSLMNNVGDMVGEDAPYATITHQYNNNNDAIHNINDNLSNNDGVPNRENNIEELTFLDTQGLPPTPNNATTHNATPPPPIPAPQHHHQHHHLHATHSDALARHLRHNLRSRQLLTGRNPLTGGFFNKLALYACQPAQRESGSGYTALHIAILHHAKVPVFHLLLDAGLSLLDTDRHQCNAYHLLLQGNKHMKLSDNNNNSNIVTVHTASETNDLWERKLEYCQQLFCPLEIQRWKSYQSDWRPRTLEFMYRLQSPFLQRNVHGEHVLDILLRKILSSNPANIQDHVPQLQLQILKLLLVTLVEDMQILLHHNLSPVENLWMRVLYETFTQEEKLKRFLHPSLNDEECSPTGPLTERLCAAIREETCSKLSYFYHSNNNNSNKNNINNSGDKIETIATTLYHSLHTTLPFTLVAMALIQRLRIMYYHTSTAETEAETLVEDDTKDETLPVGETRDCFGRLVLYTSSSFPVTNNDYEKNNIDKKIKNTNNININIDVNIDNNTNNSHNVTNIDALYEEHALADNAEYLFALSALSLKTLHNH